MARPVATTVRHGQKHVGRAQPRMAIEASTATRTRVREPIPVRIRAAASAAALEFRYCFDSQLFLQKKIPAALHHREVLIRYRSLV